MVAVGYSVGPARQYPTAVYPLNGGLRYLQENAERLHIDRDRIVLAGDSAGAQLTSQLAAIVTNPDYAREVGITPALDAAQLRGLVLCCGVFNLAALDHLRGVLGWGFYFCDLVLQRRPPLREQSGTEADVQIGLNDRGLSSAFITGGNGDGLTAIQSRPLAAKLESLGVPTTALFFPEDYAPSLPHEYQFTLDTAAGREALERILGFLEERFNAEEASR